MIEIVSFLVCLYPELSNKTVGQLNYIAMAILEMAGQVTMYSGRSIRDTGSKT